MAEIIAIVAMDSPAVLAFSETEMVHERDAKLLEVGAYPDKGLTVTEADLDGIVSRFSEAGAPIKVEHMDTPLDPLGRVQKVWRDGNALMAKLLFPEDLAGFLRRRGVQKLSVGLSREAVGLALAEVSLVLKPRVAAAAMFGTEPLGTPPARSSLPPLLGKGQFGEEGEDQKDREIARLRLELSAREVNAQIGALKAAGRVVPATEGLARALLSLSGDSLITLSEGGAAETVASVFLQFLQAQPPLVKFGETATGEAGNTDEPGMTTEEADWLKEKLGVDPQKVAAHLASDTREENNNGNR
jgi:hypothetical protein